jgi:alkyl sulfatase BDS1-like metallo-beta-lactamase superfamily hydrolase
MARAREDFKQGEYRWVASVMNQLVLADPANRAARELGADALEQLGYQAEAGTWRNAYLYGAQELRNGVMKIPVGNTLNADTLKAVSNEMFFDFLSVRLNAQKAEGKTLVVNWNFTEPRQQFVLNLENSALTHVAGKQSDRADATLTLARSTLDAVTLRKTTFPEAVQAGLIKIEGDPTKLVELLGMLDTFNPMFEVVEPKRAAQP